MINRFTLAGLLLVLAIAGIGALAVVALDGDGRETARPSDRAADTGAPPPHQPAATATVRQSASVPARKTKNLARAAKLAGCTLAEERNEGAEHVQRALTAADYDVNPPTSGLHNPVWAQDGIYPPGKTPALGMLVHTLEHGRIDIQYKPGTDATTIARLTTLYKEMDNGYHLLLFENSTRMRFAVAATAWDHLLGCPKMNDRVFDAIRGFRATYVDQGPEVVP